MRNDQGNEAGDRNGAEGASAAIRLTAPADEVRTPRLPFPVVGIGASAGGLEAYTEFLQACPSDAGMAYVFVQHLPPDRDSLLVEILARQTRMSVVEVTDGLAVEPDHVYVIRPGHTLTIRDGTLHLGPELAARGHGRPVDDLFRSLAEEQQQRAIAVVFSGMGSNGTAGAQAVKAVGGLVIAQEPDTAKFPAMPRSLIDAHLPDFILRPSEVPAVLVKYARQPYAADDHAATVATSQDERTLADVLAVLRTRTRHDFAGYRKPTLLRRVRRRMGLGQFALMADYVRTLRQTPGEVTALADDLLIHVTGFFRDPEAWDALKERVIEPLAESRADGAEIRCWVSACATGEEAYSLAILLTEAAEVRGKRFDIKVFATDMAERALGAARAGVFPNGIESQVSPERLSHFFDKDDCFYRVKKDLRELVIFAPQNVLQDPPFSRLDIVTCRNLMIYLELETQRRLLALLHFGLREGGTLMLGSSESSALADGDFEPIDKKHRIFRRVGPTRAGTLSLPAQMALNREVRSAASPAIPRPTALAADQLVSRALLDQHSPAAVAVDASGQLVHVHGNTARFLTLPGGMPTLDLVALANEQVRGAVRTALHRATEAQAPVTVRDGLIDTPDGRRRVEVGVAPLGPSGAGPLYLVTFRDYPEPLPPADGEPSASGQLADELQRARGELQGVLEEMQSSNEELKASHEEATSLNEELQSTNEELETSKEEMQSLNEELVTVNAQLQAKMIELETTANDLGSLLTSTDIAVLFLDPRFRIRRFTPAVKDLLDLIPSDVGRPFSDLRRKFTDPALLADAQAVLDKLIPIEQLIESESGRHYSRRILPYRTQDHRIAGVVVAFLDITERKAAEKALSEEKEYAEKIVQTLHEPLLVLHPDLTVRSANSAFFTHFRVEPAETIGRRVYDLGNGQWNIPALRTLLEDVLPENNMFDDYEVTHTFATLGRRVMVINGRRLDHVQLILLGIRDITERKQAEEALQASEERQRLILESATDFAILTLAPDRTVTSWSPGATATFGFAPDEILGRSGDVLFTPEDRAAGAPEAEATEARRAGRAADERWHLRKDGTRFYASGVTTLLRDGGGFVKVARDLTDRKRMDDELGEARDRLEVRVAERTADLGHTMDSLEAEMERRRDLARRLSTAQEDERRRVARDLHDSVGQLLTGLSLSFKAIETSGHLPAPAVERLVDAQRIMNDLGRELHGLAVRLRPTALDDIGLEAALGQLVSEWSNRTGVRVEFHASGLAGERFPAEVDTAVYRVVQEALTNISKHSKAMAVGVVVTRPDGFVSVVVEDNGAGFNPAATPNGRLGLLGMRERVEFVGGEVDIESSPGAGTTVAVQIPIPPKGGVS